MNPMAALLERLRERSNSEHVQAIIRIVIVALVLTHLWGTYVPSSGNFNRGNGEFLLLEGLGAALALAVGLFVSICVSPVECRRMSTTITMSDSDRSLGPPRTRVAGRSPRLIARVLNEVARGGENFGVGSSHRRRPTLARLGRGHVVHASRRTSVDRALNCPRASSRFGPGPRTRTRRRTPPQSGNPNAVLRGLDSAAACKLPCLDVFIHRCRPISSTACQASSVRNC